MRPAQNRNSILDARARLRGSNRVALDDEGDVPWNWVFDSNAEDTNDKTEARIVGAKNGPFEVRIGDCVMIKGEELKGEMFTGLVGEFDYDQDGDQAANVMWFSTEAEVKNNGKRSDYLSNEIYLNPSQDLVPLPSITGYAKIFSEQRYNTAYPNGVSKKSKDYGKVFVCRRGCNPRTAAYTDEFIWEDIYSGRDSDIEFIWDIVREGTKRKRGKKPLKAVKIKTPCKKRKLSKDTEADIYDDNDNGSSFNELSSAEEESEDDMDYHDEKIVHTPKKRRGTTVPTPKSGKKVVTPSRQKIAIKKPLLFTPLATRTLSLEHLSTPYALARHRLHVSTLPASLPCRDEEFTEVYTHLSAAITDGTGSCIYISGTPGTGKTATVREVITQLQQLVASEELDEFTFVEINGMKVTDPHQSYALLWEAIKNERVSPSQALGLLEREFSTPSPRRVPCVVLMDELDQLVTRGQGVMYNFFNWPGMRHSRLIVLAVANTMDLPERTLSNKISSRLGLTRITFPGYTHSQLMTIIQSRLEGVPGSLVDPDAIQFAARKVAAVSGDARRALDICRRAVELVEHGDNMSSSIVDTPSRKTSRRHGSVEGIGSKYGSRVTISIIRKAITEATSSPLATYLKLLPLAHKIFLCALLARIRRSGLSENTLAEVFEEADRTVALQDDYIQEVCRGGARAAGLGQAVHSLADGGIIGLEGRRGERGGRARFLVSEEDVRTALRNDMEVGGMVAGN